MKKITKSEKDKIISNVSLSTKLSRLMLNPTKKDLSEENLEAVRIELEEYNKEQFSFKFEMNNNGPKISINPVKKMNEPVITINSIGHSFKREFVFTKG